MPVIRAGVVHDTATVAGTPDVVCRYLAHFSNTPDWDPGCLSGKPVDDSPLQVGKQFALVTEFKGTKSDMIYTLTRYEPPHVIELHGDSKTVTAIDTIRLSTNKDDPSKTDVDYTADISLKGWRKPFIVFINSALDDLGRNAMDGMRKNITPERLAQFQASESRNQQ